MKKLLIIFLTSLAIQTIGAQRGGHFSGGGMRGGGERFNGGISHREFTQAPRVSAPSVTYNTMRQPTTVTMERHNSQPLNIFRGGFFGHRAYIPYAHRGVNFYYNRGFFYDSYYNWMYPPIGFALMALPYGYYNFTYGGNPYYYYGGVYYVQNQNQYEVVSPVIGAIVPELPKETKVIIIDGKKCFVTKDNVYYEEYVDGDVLKYKVIGKEYK